MVAASIRLLPSPLLSLAPRCSLYSFSCRNRPSSTIAFSSIHSTSTKGDGGVELGNDEADVIFLGTGTSEGVPRVSCLTNSLNKCEVCSKAAQPGNKNRRRNTSILIRHPNSSGTHNNILIDAGKYGFNCPM